MSTFGLTPRQRKAVTAIEELTQSHGRAPSLDELRQRLGHRNKGSVQEMMARLAERGAVTWTPGRAGTLKAVRPAEPDGEVVGLFDAPWLFSAHDLLMISLIRSDPARQVAAPVGAEDVR
jgi:SOS-response transcriptional repressor LexA